MLSYGSLKEVHRNLRDSFEESFSIRVHRALSWLERAEKKAQTQTPASYFTGFPSTRITPLN